MLKLTKENILDVFYKGDFAIYCETKEELKQLLFILKKSDYYRIIDKIYVFMYSNRLYLVNYIYDEFFKKINFDEFKEIYYNKSKKLKLKKSSTKEFVKINIKELEKDYNKTKKTNELHKKMNIEKYKNQIIHFFDKDLRFEIDFVTRFKIPMEKEESYSSAIVKWLTSYEEDKIKLKKFEYDLIDIYYKKDLPNNINQKLKQYNIICQLKEKGNFKNVDLEMTIGELKNRMEVE